MPFNLFSNNYIKLMAYVIFFSFSAIVLFFYYSPISDVLRVNGALVFFDYAHFVGGFLLGVALVYCFRRKANFLNWNIFLFLALILLLITGVLELLQYFGSRTSSLSDWFRSYSGAIVGLLIYYSFYKSLKLFFFVLVFSIGVLTWFVLVPLLYYVNASLYYKKNFPVLGSFEKSSYDKLVWLPTGGVCNYKHDYSNDWATAGDGSLKLFLGDDLCKTVKFNALGYFWNGFQKIAFDVYSNSEKKASVKVRVFQGLPSNKNYKSKSVRLYQGLNSVVLNLQDLKYSIKPEAPEMSRIDISFSTKVLPAVFYLDNVRLLMDE